MILILLFKEKILNGSKTTNYKTKIRGPYDNENDQITFLLL